MSLGIMQSLDAWWGGGSVLLGEMYGNCDCNDNHNCFIAAGDVVVLFSTTIITTTQQLLLNCTNFHDMY